MLAKGALHVHSTLSHDGTLTIPELVQWYRSRGYHFIAIGEHSQDLDEAKIKHLLQAAIAHSSRQFLVIPGIEFSCRNGTHIFGMGMTHLIDDAHPVAVAREIHDHDGIAILAHPRRMKWQCAPELLQVLDAIEIWNVAYDGKFLPSFHAPLGFRRFREANPRLLAIAGQDFHRKPSFHDVCLQLGVTRLHRDDVMEVVRSGQYLIKSPLFRTDARFQLSLFRSLSLHLFSRQIFGLRKARDVVLRRPK